MKKAPHRLAPRRSARFIIYIALFLVAVGLLCFAAFQLAPKSQPSNIQQQQQLKTNTTASMGVAEEEPDQDEIEFEKNNVLQQQHPKITIKDDDDDPMSKFIIGYPMQPLTLNNLRLCDEQQTIILHGSYKCPQDYSCLACVKPSEANRFRELHGAFRDPQLELQRNNKLLEDFAGQDTIVMFTFNYAHSDLFLNWACSAAKLGLDVKAFTLVIPCDDRTTKLAQDLGFKTLDSAWQTKLSKPIKQKESFWGQDHADINNIALFAMSDLTSLGFNVFVHDADIAWLRDPFPFFRQAGKRRDFIGMLAPFWTSMGPVNTGLLYLRPTTQTKVFLKSMENAAIVKGTSDQRLWNAILRHFSFQQLEWRLLPQNIVYKYSGSKAVPPGEDTLLLHAVGSGKREKMARFNLWLLDKSCPFYNEDAVQLNAKERQQT